MFEHIVKEADVGLNASDIELKQSSLHFLHSWLEVPTLDNHLQKFVSQLATIKK